MLTYPGKLKYHNDSPNKNRKLTKKKLLFSWNSCCKYQPLSSFSECKWSTFLFILLNQTCHSLNMYITALLSQLGSFGFLWYLHDNVESKTMKWLAHFYCQDDKESYHGNLMFPSLQCFYIIVRICFETQHLRLNVVKFTTDVMIQCICHMVLCS